MTVFSEELLEQVLKQFEKGKSMRTIERIPGMPCRRTIERWSRDDAEIAERVLDAREAGYAARAERAIKNAKNATDAALGRLEFDAERWYLGKLSRAFSDDKARKLEHSVQLTEETRAWLGMAS